VRRGNGFEGAAGVTVRTVGETIVRATHRPTSGAAHFANGLSQLHVIVFLSSLTPRTAAPPHTAAMRSGSTSRRSSATACTQETAGQPLYA